MIKRCSWASNETDLVMIEYHDNEYGIMLEDNTALFELLSMELMQAGLSWKVVLDKREALKNRFKEYELNSIVRLSEDDIIELYQAKDIIRNKMKIDAIVNNAKVILENDINLKRYILDNFEIYGDDYQKCAKQYKKDGFKFIGPSVIESLYQALGLIEGHQKECFRYGL